MVCEINSADESVSSEEWKCMSDSPVVKTWKVIVARQPLPELPATVPFFEPATLSHPGAGVETSHDPSSDLGPKKPFVSSYPYWVL